MFNDEVVYSKLNKKALDTLFKSGACNDLMDDRFFGTKHFWASCVSERPKNKKKLLENIDLMRDEGDFSVEEMIENLSTLTGVFPIHLVLDEDVQQRLDHYQVPPLGEWDNDLGVAWFIPREIVKKKTKNNKDYWIVKVIDSTNASTSIKCWGVKKRDEIYINRPYMSKLEYDEQWGFSTRSVYHNFRLLG